MTDAPDWLETSFTHSLFSKKKEDAHKQFQKFVEKGIDIDSPYRELKEGIILGSPQFVDWIWRTQTNGSEDVKEIPRNQRVVGRPSLEGLFENVKDLEGRNACIIAARKRCGYLNTEIARFLRISNSTVGKIVRGTYNIK